MDVRRSCSKAFMFWDAAQTRGSRVRWFFVDGAPFFPGPHQFTSEIWDQVHWGNPGPGETDKLPQPYDRGAPPSPFFPAPPKEGDALCAPLEWFRDGAPSDAPPLKWLNYVPACCTPAVTLNGCSCARKAHDRFKGCSCAVGSLTIISPIFKSVAGCSCADQGGVATLCCPLFRLPFKWAAKITAPGCVCLDGVIVILNWDAAHSQWYGQNDIVCNGNPITLDLRVHCVGGAWPLSSTGTPIGALNNLTQSTCFPFHFLYVSAIGLCPGPIFPTPIGLDMIPTP
jgi:hypothetical protein